MSTLSNTVNLAGDDPLKKKGLDVKLPPTAAEIRFVDEGDQEAYNSFMFVGHPMQH